MSHPPAEDRFLAKIARVPTFMGWWVWAGWDDDGYGRFRVGEQRVYAHRWAYERWVGPIPDGLHLDHLCRNKRCANPLHLEPVEFRENIRRGNNPGRKVSRRCVRGHPFAGDNLYVSPRGTRGCRACRRDSSRKFQRRKAST